jgi:CheY-like chemotaxis protein
MTLDPASLRILLVEDAATMRKTERRTLASLGFDKVTEAGTATIFSFGCAPTRPHGASPSSWPPVRGT